MNNPAIVCIDDDFLILKSLERELSSSFGDNFSIEMAESASEALELVKNLIDEGIEIPIIICDYIIPDMKGDELLTELHKIIPSACKILLTGQADIEGITRAVNQASLFGYISKPWKRSELLKRINDGLSLYYKNRELEIHRHKIMEKNFELEGLNSLLTDEKFKLDLALEASDLSLWEWDIEEKHLHSFYDFNQNIKNQHTLSYPLKEILRAIHPDDKNELKKIFSLVTLRNENPVSIEIRMYNGAEELRWYSIFARYSPVSHIKKYPVVIGTGRDITKQKALDNQMRENQKLQAVGRMAGGISHDFNNTLQAILGYSKLIQSTISNPDDPQSGFIQEVIDAGERAKMLTRQLLTFSRREQFNPSPCDINLLIEGIVNMLSRILGDLITIRLNLTPSLPIIEADNGQIEQAIVNLCINSKDALPYGGDITINTGMKDNMIFFEVVDDGIGISEDEIDHVMKPFYTTKDKEKGTGLGLATVAAIINNHKGRIKLKSRKSEGTKVSIFLPCCEQTHLKSSIEKDIEILSDKKMIKQKQRILFAEDDPIIRRLVPLTLQKAGYTLYIAENGRKAVELFKKHQDQIDLLIFDVIMPDMNGREACDQIKKIKPEIPVIFTSGYSSDLLESEYMVRIQGQLLQKPYSMNDLIKLLEKTIEKLPPFKKNGDIIFSEDS